MKNTNPNENRKKSANEAALQLENLLLFAKGRHIDVIAEIYGIIEDIPIPDSGRLLQRIATLYKSPHHTPKHAIQEAFPLDMLPDLARNFGETADAMLDSLLRRNLPNLDFYCTLWEIINNPFFSSREARIYALARALHDSRIPYFQIDPPPIISDEEFSEHIRDLEDQVQRCSYILHATTLEDETQRAALLLDLLDDIEGRPRISLMTAIMTISHQQGAEDTERETEQDGSESGGDK